MKGKLYGDHDHLRGNLNWLQTNLFNGNADITMYAKLGYLAKAQMVFDMLPVRDVVSWNVLIAGYGKSEKALTCYRLMQVEGISPDAFTYVSILNASGAFGKVEKGRMLHKEVVMRGLFECNIVVGNALLDMYAKCDSLLEVQKVFDSLPIRDVISWNVIISGYAKSHDVHKTIECFKRMLIQGCPRNAVTYVSVLKSCSPFQGIEKGKEIHAEIIQQRLLERNVVLGNVLVDMYAEYGCLPEAHEAFDKLPVQNVVSWTSLIAGYAKHDKNEEAIQCFDQIQLKGIVPNSVTFLYALKACGNLGAVDKGTVIHIEIARKGLLGTDPMVSNAIVVMYIKCGFLGKAQEVFYNLEAQDEILWTALIAGYVRHGLYHEALQCFESMQIEAIPPNPVTFVSILKACGSIAAADGGIKIYAKVCEKGLLRSDVVVGNAVIDMFVKCKLLSKAQSVFDELHIRDLISWTTLIAGYIEHEMAEEAITCFQQMQLEGFSPNDTAFVCILKGCGILGAVGMGTKIHGEIASKGISDRNPFVGNALVNMYAKCGLLQKAQEVFNLIQVRDVVAWTALITGYVQLGDSVNVFHIFDTMKVEGIKPDCVTYLSILSACSHMGLVDMGHIYFNAMVEDYNGGPELEHYTCVIDLLSRTGNVDCALDTLKKMHYPADVVLWHAVLDASRKLGHVQLQEWCTNKQCD